MSVATSPTISQVAAIIKTLKTDIDLGKFHKAKSVKSKKAVKLNTGNICGCCGKQTKMSNVKTAQSLYTEYETPTLSLKTPRISYLRFPKHENK